MGHISMPLTRNCESERYTEDNRMTVGDKAS